MNPTKSTMGSVLAIFTIAASLFVSTQGLAATDQSNEIDPGEFRERLISWALASEQKFGSGLDLADKIAALSDEQVEIWLSTIQDPEALVRSTERVVSLWLQDQEAGPPTRSASSPGPFTTPFPPDYPPGSGPYKNVIIDAIAAFGITGATSTSRCDASSWGNFVAVWWPLNKAIDTLDGACVVAGCDPTGLVCAGVCGTLEAAKIALKIAAVPLEACDVHQGAIDGAEIEATYENTLGLVGDVSHVHDDLAAHDTNIDTDLAAHDLNIDTDLAAHDLNIDTDLAQHDTDIKALLGNLQTTLELMRRLHIDVIQVEEKKHYLLAVTEAGNAVSGAMLVSVHAGAPKKGNPFQDITGITSTTELRPGVLEVRMGSLPGAVDSDTIFQFLVEEVGHGPFTHSGTALVSGDSNSTFLGPGQ